LIIPIYITSCSQKVCDLHDIVTAPDPVVLAFGLDLGLGLDFGLDLAVNTSGAPGPMSKKALVEGVYR